MPIPTNDSERLLFPHLFQTLTRISCEGKVRPELASTWKSDETGRVWTFTLREGARFTDGSAVTAYHVLASVFAGGDRVKALGIDTAVALDDRRLRVSVRGARDSAPRLFAEPVLTAISGLARQPGPFLAIDIPPSGSRPPLDFRIMPDGDLRDELDRGADLVVTRDPALVDYAKGLPEFATFPLPWNRTYALLQPAAAEPFDTAGAGSERRSPAQDAVRADARAAEPPFWWSEVAACPARASPAATPTSSRVVYTRGDEVARGLAERVVALAGLGTGLRTEALGRAEFTATLRSGSERAYVVALPRQTLAPCREAAALPDGARIQPLIDTRAHAVVRKGAPPLTVEWDGTVRVVEP